MDEVCILLCRQRFILKATPPLHIFYVKILKIKKWKAEYLVNFNTKINNNIWASAFFCSISYSPYERPLHLTRFNSKINILSVQKIHDIPVLPLNVSDVVRFSFAFLRTKRTLKFRFFPALPQYVSLERILAYICATACRTRENSVRMRPFV